MKHETRIIQILVTIGAIALYTIHYVEPKISLDFTTLVLLSIFALAWIIPMLKLEIPSNLKMQFHDLEKITGSLENVGLLNSKEESSEHENMNADNPWHIMTNADSNLALATFRIELEKKLRQLAAENNISFQDMDAKELCRQLRDKGVITRDENVVLIDLIDILTSSMRMEHAESTDKILQWVMKVGPKLLLTLDAKSTNT